MENPNYDYGLWASVVFSVMFFAVFVVGFLRPKRKLEWRSLGVFTGFIVALFTEMYGFPLTVYILTSSLGGKLNIPNPFGHIEGHLLGTLLGFPDQIKSLICTIGSLGMLLGLIVMGKGWKKIHKAGGELVTNGIYSYMRHPQYSGLFLIIVGMLIQWPTLITLLMWPALIVAYYRLAKSEEVEMAEKFGEKYLEYKRQVPAFLPGLPKRYGEDEVS